MQQSSWRPLHAARAAAREQQLEQPTTAVARNRRQSSLKEALSHDHERFGLNPTPMLRQLQIAPTAQTTAAMFDGHERALQARQSGAWDPLSACHEWPQVQWSWPWLPHQSLCWLALREWNPPAILQAPRHTPRPLLPDQHHHLHQNLQGPLALVLLREHQMHLGQERAVLACAYRMPFLAHPE